ncbi:MAG: type 1 glutamine amidotransferase domain-containing protein [Acetobacterales bacterium]
MAESLSGRNVAVLVTDGFEEVELTRPVARLKEEGATVHIVAPGSDSVMSWQVDSWGETFPVDVRLESVRAEDYDALLLPGGVLNPDQLRTRAEAVAFVRSFVDRGKPIAAICHGPWTLIETGAVKGRRMTSYPSVRTDLVNAGADWVDEEVVVDDGLVTSRDPDDLPAFNNRMVEVFAGDR